MTGSTHRNGGMLVSVVGFQVLRSNQLLLPDVNIGLQWLIIYAFCMWGSVASDLDHHWDSCPSHSYPDKAVNTILHLTKPLQEGIGKELSEKQKRESKIYKLSGVLNAKHRSWQTHSDITLFAMLFVLHKVMNGEFSQLGAVDVAISSLVLAGICLGVIAHLILDVLTPEGVWSSVLLLIKKLFPKLGLSGRLHLVPNTEYFSTGGKWESKVRLWLKWLTYLAIFYLAWVYLSPYIKDILPFEIQFDYGG